jgi:hypothetical protein
MPRFKVVDGVASENSVHLTRGQQLWRDQGLLIATGGNTTDFNHRGDRTFAGEIVRNLQDEGLSLVEFGQGFLSMGPVARDKTPSSSSRANERADLLLLGPSEREFCVPI